MNWVAAILCTMLKTAARRAGRAALNTEAVLEVNASRLRERFDQWLKEPNAYHQWALRECSAFPEGRVYPFAIPALGYANVGLGDANERKHSAAQMQALFEQAGLDVQAQPAVVLRFVRITIGTKPVED